MILRCAAVCMVALVLARPALAQDISGVRLGSTLSEASIAIKRANKAYALKPLKDDAGKLKGLAAMSRSGEAGSWDDAVDEFAVLQDAAGKVWYVARYQRMLPGSRVSMAALLDSLTKKFGEPGKRVDGGRSASRIYAWDTDSGGKPVSASLRDSPCNGIRFHRSAMTDGYISAPSTFPAGCGTRIVLSDFFVEDGLVEQFTLRIINVKTAYDANWRTEVLRDAQRERERKNGVKPQI